MKSVTVEFEVVLPSNSNRSVLHVFIFHICCVCNNQIPTESLLNCNCNRNLDVHVPYCFPLVNCIERRWKPIAFQRTSLECRWMGVYRYYCRTYVMYAQKKSAVVGVSVSTATVAVCCGCTQFFSTGVVSFVFGTAQSLDGCTRRPLFNLTFNPNSNIRFCYWIVRVDRRGSSSSILYSKIEKWVLVSHPLLLDNRQWQTRLMAESLSSKQSLIANIQGQ